MFGLVTRSLLTSLRPVLEPDEEEESWLILQQLPWQQLLQLHRHHPEQNWQNTNIEWHILFKLFFPNKWSTFLIGTIWCALCFAVLSMHQTSKPSCLSQSWLPRHLSSAPEMEKAEKWARTIKNTRSRNPQEPWKDHWNHWIITRKTNWITTRKTSTTCSKQTTLLFASASECPGWGWGRLLKMLQRYWQIFITC